MSIRHLSDNLAQTRDPRLAALFHQIRREFGALVDPLLIHSVDAELLGGAWASLRETLVAEGRVPRRFKEVAAVGVSIANACPWCVDAHTIMLSALGSDPSAKRLRRAPKSPLPDPALEAVAQWAKNSRHPRSSQVTHPPFSLSEAPEFIGTAFCFHYINRLVTILLGDSPVPAKHKLMRRIIIFFSVRVFGRAIRRPHPAGASLSMAGASACSGRFAWAHSNPHIEAAFSALEDAILKAAEDVFTTDTQCAVRSFIASWQGDEMPLGRAWLDQALACLPSFERPAARLALLAALAPHRATDEDVRDFRETWPDDRRLMAVLSWGAWQAAVRVTEWLLAPFRE